LKNTAEYKHNKSAPYWAICLFVFGLTGISTIWINLGNFWNGYVLDMTGLHGIIFCLEVFSPHIPKINGLAFSHLLGQC